MQEDKTNNEEIKEEFAYICGYADAFEKLLKTLIQIYQENGITIKKESE